MILLIVVLSTMFTVINSKPQTDLASSTTTEKENESERVKTITIYILAAALCIVSSVLLWVLLRKRCRKIKLPKIEERNESISSKSTNNLATVGKAENHAQADTVSNASNLTTANQNLMNSSNAATTNPPSPSRVSKPIPGTMNDGAETPPQMSPTHPQTSIAKSLEDIPEESQNMSEVRTPVTDYKLNMMKNCFGEALNKANKKKPFKLARPLRPVTEFETPTVNEETKTSTAALSTSQLTMGESETNLRPTSVTQENDIYVSADNVDNISPTLRSNKDDTHRAPVIRPPTAFIGDPEDTNAEADEEYDFPKSMRPLSHVPNGKTDSATMEEASEKEVESEGDEMYDFPSETLRKISLTDGIFPNDGYKAPKYTYKPSNDAIHLYGNCVPAPILNKPLTTIGTPKPLLKTL